MVVLAGEEAQALAQPGGHLIPRVGASFRAQQLVV